jgi:hypothetical protein
MLVMAVRLCTRYTPSERSRTLARRAARSVGSTRRARRKKTGASAIPASAGSSRQAQGWYPKAHTPTAMSSLAVGGWTHSVGGSPLRYCSAVFA